MIRSRLREMVQCGPSFVGCPPAVDAARHPRRRGQGESRGGVALPGKSGVNLVNAPALPPAHKPSTDPCCRLHSGVWATSGQRLANVWPTSGGRLSCVRHPSNRRAQGVLTTAWRTPMCASGGVQEQAQASRVHGLAHYDSWTRQVQLGRVGRACASRCGAWRAG
jgi:hypothetical protein